MTRLCSFNSLRVKDTRKEDDFLLCTFVQEDEKKKSHRLLFGRRALGIPQVLNKSQPLINSMIYVIFWLVFIV